MFESTVLLQAIYMALTRNPFHITPAHDLYT